MTLVDTTAWVGFLERPGQAPTGRQRAGLHLAELIRQRALVWTTEIVALEVLAGAQHSAHVLKLRSLLFSTAFAPSLGLADYEAAARLIRFLRARRGQELSASAAVVAAVANRLGLDVLTSDEGLLALGRTEHVRLAQL